MKIALVLGLAALITFSSCKLNNDRETITKVEIARDGGITPHKGRVFAIDNSLNCYFYGAKEYKYNGLFKGRISAQDWKMVGDSLNSLNYTKIAETDSVFKPDVEYFEILIYSSNNKKRLIRCSCNTRDQVVMKMKLILNICEYIPLTKYKGKVKFGTTYQVPPLKPSRK